MAEVGRPTELTEECFGKIKKSIIDGNDLKTTANVCGIEINTLYDWTSRNYLNICDKIEGWKRDRKIMLATKNLENYLDMNTNNVVKVGDEEAIKTDVGLEKIKADMTKFTLETLDKENYAKRSELTGKNGGELIIKTVNYGDNDTSQLPTETIPASSS